MNAARPQVPKNLMVLGLMSGTSMDGIDAVLVRLDPTGDETLLHHFVPYAKDLRKGLGAIVAKPNLSLSEFGALDLAVGKAMGAAAKTCWQRWLAKSKSDAPLLLIGSHGQTIFHEPDRGISLQIGAPQAIVAATGATVVSDFRRADILAGGEGAPLAPLYHRRIIEQRRGTTRGIAIHNLGGISNFTYFPSAGTTIALDTGPASCLMDLAMEKLSKGKLKFDRNGAWAKRGNVRQEWLKRWLNYTDVQKYRRRRGPKSTGRELFSADLLARMLKDAKLPRSVSASISHDILATLLQFSIALIAESYGSYVLEKGEPLEEIIVAGGGSKNPLFLERLSESLPGVRVTTMKALGVDPQVVEAQAFAYFAACCLIAEPQSIPSVTGAKKSVVGGSITPGSNWPLLYPKIYSANGEAFPFGEYSAASSRCAELQ